MASRSRHIHTFLAQITASSISVILTIVAARSLEPDALGYLAIAMAVQALAQGLVRAFAAEPVLFSHSSYQGGLQGLVGPSTTVTLVAGVGTGMLAWALAATVGEGWLGAAMAMAFLTTFTQDHLRTILFIQKKGLQALAADGVGLLIMCVALVWSTSIAQPFAYLLAWGMGAGASSLVCAGFVRPTISLRSLPAWIREHRKDGGLFSLDFAVTSGLNQVSVLVVAAVVGASGAAALRGAQVLITPVSLVLRAGIAAVAPAIVGAAAVRDLRRAYRIAVAFSLAATASAAVCILWLVVPTMWVEALLGDSAQLALGAVVAAAFAWGATGVAIGPGLVLRATGRLSAATRLKVLLAPVSSALLVTGALVGGAAGSQAGLAAGEGLRGVLAWRQALRRPS